MGIIIWQAVGRVLIKALGVLQSKAQRQSWGVLFLVLDVSYVLLGKGFKAVRDS